VLVNVLREAELIVSKEGALVAGALVVDLEHVGGQSFRAGSFIVAQGAHKRLDVSVEVSFQTPIVHTRP